MYRKVLDLLNNSGYDAYLVGGCTRDFLMEKQPKDYDITTNATTQQIMQVFSDYTVIETGIKFGTVTVIVGGNSYEVTTYRKESEYEDFRKPGKVEFVSNLEQDLKRRDFTMNSIAMAKNGELVDYFGGKKDITERTIRAVGDPKLRFSEDALRILRAIRFASVLGFEIEKETKNAMRKCKHLLKKISVERCYVELKKILCGDYVRKVLLAYADILGEVIPELLPMKNFCQHSKYHIYDVLEHTAVCVENIPPVAYLRLTMLLHDIGKPEAFTMDLNGVGHFYGHEKISEELARVIMHRLKVDNETKHIVLTLIKYHDVNIEATDVSVKKWLSRLGDLFFDLLLVKRADCYGQNPEYIYNLLHLDKLEQIAKKVIENEQCFSKKDLNIDGNDLIEIGITDGKQIGEILKALLELVITEKIQNKKIDLLKKAKQMYSC